MMHTLFRHCCRGLAIALLLPLPAFAHPLHGSAPGLAAGLLHPLGGLDHILAMLAVGVWAARLGSGWQWRMPLLFLAAAGTAFLLPTLFALSLPVTAETGIAVSLLFLGGLIAFDVRSYAAAGGLLVTLFGAFHGLAHGMEATAGLPPLFMAGFLTTTALLHGCGLLLGHLSTAVRWLRLGGVGVAMTGMALLVIPS